MTPLDKEPQTPSVAPPNECGACALEKSYHQHGPADQCCCCEHPLTTEMEHRGDSGLSEAATECGDTCGKQHGSANPCCCEHPTTPSLERCGDSGMYTAATEGGGNKAPVRRVVLSDKTLEQLHVETRLREVRRPRTQMKLQSPLH